MAVGKAGKRKSRSCAIPLISALFLVLVATGLTMSERAMNAMLGGNHFKAFARLARTPQGRVDITFMGRLYHGPRIPWPAGEGRLKDHVAAESTTNGATKAGRVADRKGWLTAVGKLLDEVRQIGSDVRRLFSTWQLDGSWQDLQSPR